MNRVYHFGIILKRGVYGKLLKLQNMLKYGTGILICVILPMTVYVIDILITVNVIESKDYKNALNHWQDDTNADNKPIPTMNATGYNEYKLKETWFYEVRNFFKFELHFFIS